MDDNAIDDPTELSNSALPVTVNECAPEELSSKKPTNFTRPEDIKLRLESKIKEFNTVRLFVLKLKVLLEAVNKLEAAEAFVKIELEKVCVFVPLESPTVTVLAVKLSCLIAFDEGYKSIAFELEVETKIVLPLEATVLGSRK